MCRTNHSSKCGCRRNCAITDAVQCEADHILAARFLKRFLEHDVPWLHVGLCASRCEGGLGSVVGDVTGFGVGWGLRMFYMAA